MVTEFAHIEVKPGMEKAFLEGAAKSRPIFLAAEGCFGMGVQRSVEEPHKFLLMVQWESVEAHMVVFRQSQGFQQWRENVSQCFAAPPNVWHGETVV
ncbi:MAG: antibiotic biosynthesis monooxygenase [Proteobacteria bacterium]|nr:antibiotic biosynthesis monooxygenase [Pseudomonadota bacterium]MBU6424784.1 antibiotic biosynthesis monooxygenase [Rhodospirillales bacterium]